MLTLTPLTKAACAAALLCAILAAVGLAGQQTGQGQSAGGEGREIVVSGQPQGAASGNEDGGAVIGAGGFGNAAGTSGAGFGLGSSDGLTGMMSGSLAGQPQIAFDLKAKTPAEQNYERVLAEQTNIDFVDTPLTDVVLFLEDQHSIQIDVDIRALDDVGIGADTPVSKSIRGVSLRSALNLLLRDLDLDYLIENEVLNITTAEVADTTVTTHVYDVSSLHAIGAAEDLAEVVQASIRPESWRQNPDEPVVDPAALVGSISAAGGALIVSHNRRAHEEVAELLAQLSRVGSPKAAN